MDYSAILKSNSYFFFCGHAISFMCMINGEELADFSVFLIFVLSIVGDVPE